MVTVDPALISGWQFVSPRMSSSPAARSFCTASASACASSAAPTEASVIVVEPPTRVDSDAFSLKRSKPVPMALLATPDRLDVPFTERWVAGSQPLTVTSLTLPAALNLAENAITDSPHTRVMGGFCDRFLKLRASPSTHHSAPLRNARSSSIEWSESS